MAEDSEPNTRLTLPGRISFTIRRPPVLRAFPTKRFSRHANVRHSEINPADKRSGSKESPGCLERIVKSTKFELCVALVIVGNCFTMGVEAEYLLDRMQHWHGVIFWSDHIFTFLFSLEIVMRIKVFGYRHFLPFRPHGCKMNFMDMLIVVITGVLPAWVLPFIISQQEAKQIKTLTVLRSIRMIRLVRIVRKVEAFHEVWLLLRGLTESFRTLFWTVIVIFLITYMFAIFGVVLISKELQEERARLIDSSTDPEVASELEQIEGETLGLFPMMYTLIQVLTLDSWSASVRRMMHYVWWVWIFFYIYICVGVFVLLNLVTAIIVESALANSKKDEEQLLAQKQRMKRQVHEQFRQLFLMIDSDDDGHLTREEFEDAFNNPEVSTKFKLLDFHEDDCRELFDLLDTGDNELSLTEFFEGLTRMEGVAQAKDMFRLIKMLETSNKMITQHSAEMHHDLKVIMQTVLPTAKVGDRPGNLRRRSAGGRKSSSLLSSPLMRSEENASEPGSPMPAKEPKDSGVLNGARMVSADKLGQVAAPMPSPHRVSGEWKGPLSTVSQGLGECKQEIADSKGEIKECNEKIDMLGRELAEVRSLLGSVLQHLQYQSQAPLGPHPVVHSSSRASRTIAGRSVPTCTW